MDFITGLIVNPVLDILVDSRSVGYEEGPREVRVQQRLSMPAQCELFYRHPVRGDSDFAAFAAQFQPGKSLHVKLDQFKDALFEGDITAFEIVFTQDNYQELYVRAYDRLHRLRKRQSVRALEGMDISKLAGLLTREDGLRVVDRTRVGLGGVSKLYGWPLMIQHQQNDLELLVESAAQAGVYLMVDGEELSLITLAGLAGNPAKLVVSSSLFSARFEANMDRAALSVRAQGWDATRVKAHSGRAVAARSGREVQAKTNLNSISSAGAFTLVNEWAVEDSYAEALAQSDLDWRSANEITFSGVALGNPELRPGRHVSVDGDVIPANVRGRYVITEATHTLNPTEGYQTEISTAPPERLAQQRGDVVAFGVVYKIDDPEKLGRVRVQLPAYNNIATGWLQVVCPGAGKGKGFISLPDVGDTVLLILPRENPAQGVVLGGLFGEHRTPDEGLDLLNNRARFTWTTPDGQKIHLSKDGDVIRIENGAGAYIELRKSTITIAGKAVDFKKI